MKDFSTVQLIRNPLSLCTLLTLGCAIILSTGCGMKAETASTGSTGGGGDGGASSSTFKLKLTVSAYWESSSLANASVLGTCSATTTVTDVPKTTCSITVPEGQLFYSKLAFKIETDSATTCSQIGYRPYYYLMSKSAGFITPGTTTANDCSGTLWQTKPACWNGPGSTLLPPTGLQTAQGFYTLVTSSSLSYTWDIGTSPNGKFNSQVGSNRYSTSDLSEPERLTGIATGSDPYVAGVGDCAVSTNNPAGGQCYFDWYFDCRDEYNERKYSITAKIVEANGATDSFTDWDP